MVLSAGFAAAAADDEPVVVEMFLSQSCKLSPPAAAYMTELQKRPDLVVLSWHVDYWDLLSNGKAGRWKDTFSLSDSAVRQRIYNRKVRGRGTVFTPQAIVNGAGSVVGSKRRDLEALVRLAPAVQDNSEIAFSAAAGAPLKVSIKSAGGVREAFVVKFRDFAATRITGGDNVGVEFREPNVVQELVRLGTVGAHREEFSVPAPGPGWGCAILLQERGQGAITAAKYCPETR
jgi:hypothetical protein